ncbi:hypothetical protein WDW37_18380 [Bdellovibrionota bacterium FG-1]
MILFLFLIFFVLGSPFVQAFESCHSDDSRQICLGVKYVVYQGLNGRIEIDHKIAENNLKLVNLIWKRCDLSFQVDEFLQVKPLDFGLRYQAADFSDLEHVRNTFGSDRSLLVVTTAAWDRSSALGKTTANAWTTMPGSRPLGIVLEQGVGAFGNIIAHELGHYLNLYHFPDENDVMSSIIYSRSRDLSSAQCELARNTVRTYWAKMLR